MNLTVDLENGLPLHSFSKLFPFSFRQRYLIDTYELIQNFIYLYRCIFKLYSTVVFSCILMKFEQLIL